MKAEAKALRNAHPVSISLICVKCSVFLRRHAATAFVLGTHYIFKITTRNLKLHTRLQQPAVLNKRFNLFSTL